MASTRRRWPRASLRNALLAALLLGSIPLVASAAGGTGRDVPVAKPQSPTTTTTTHSPEQPAAVVEATTTTLSGADAVVAVASVTDGDTLRLADGREVRLAQVDAPERGECFGSQSTAALRALVDGRSVSLRRPSGPAKDKYGRTLAEVIVDGVSVDEALIRDGAAEWYDQFGHEDPDLAARLRIAEDEARAAGRGLWTACHKTPTSAAPTTAVAAARPLVGAAPSGNCHPAYPGDCIPPAPPDLDCGSLRRVVQVDHSHGDPHRLDADRDGVGCESYG